MNKFILIPLAIVILVVGLVGIRKFSKSKSAPIPSTTPTTSVASISSLPKITTNNNQFIDSASNNPVVLKGFVNVINISPSNNRSLQTYTLQDYQKMKSYEANYQSIRLGAKEIGAGSGLTADQEYLQRIDSMIATASTVGIYSELKLTIYDLPGFSGPQKNKSWGDFWRNSNGQQEALIAGWKNIWLRYKDSSAVVGYDLLNEPNQGDLGVSDDQFVNSYLGPFYQKTIDQLRIVDSEHLAYFQPGLNGFDNIPFKFLLNRTGVVYAPHFYPAIASYLQQLSGSGVVNTTNLQANYAPLMQQFLSEASNNKAPLLLGEYGMPWDPKFDGAAAKESAFATLENAAMDLFAQNGASYSRPWYADDRSEVKLPKVVLGWALIKGTTGLSGQPRDFILNIFKSHSIK